MIGNKTLLVAIVISIATFQFWKYLPKNSFYIGIALFIFLIALVIFRQNKNKLLPFVLICLAINNLIDELFFDPTKNGINEIITLIAIPAIYYARKIHKQRTIHFLNKSYFSSFFSSRRKNSNRNEEK